jgi:hypothetical protein
MFLRNKSWNLEANIKCFHGSTYIEELKLKLKTEIKQIQGGRCLMHHTEIWDLQIQIEVPFSSMNSTSLNKEHMKPIRKCNHPSNEKDCYEDLIIYESRNI